MAGKATGRRACIIGIGETEFSRKTEQPSFALMAEAIGQALQDAGVSHKEVEGFAVTSMRIPDDSPFVAENLGFQLSWVLNGDYGGASGPLSVVRASQAIQAGYIDLAVCVAGGNRFSELDHDVNRPIMDYSRRNFVDPYGYAGATSFFGLIQQLHMQRYGTNLEQLGKIAVTFRKHAAMNPNALLGKKDLTLDEYMNARMIADPIRLFDCVMPCSGAVAMVVAAEEVAERLGKQPVYVGPAAECINYQVREDLPDKLTTGFKVIGEKIFKQVDRESIDFLELYDDYPIAIVITLEDLGYCEKGKGGEFVANTDLSVGGDLPINTSGGQLSCGQPGLAGGHMLVVEAVRQLRGEAGERQVANARRGLCTGIGWLAYCRNVGCTAALVLEKE
ncbi:MAG: thiolase family protein [Acidobacteriota bacterium]